MAAVAKLKGQKQLIKTLNALERKLLPRATANSLNKTATKARQQVVADARHANPSRKAKDLRKWIRVTQRAKATGALVAQLSRDTPGSAAPAKRGATSTPFKVAALKGQTFVRALSGKRSSRGRPASSSPNLPIFRVGLRSRDVRAILQRSLLRAAQLQMQNFLPGEIRRQLATQVAKIRSSKK